MPVQVKALLEQDWSQVSESDPYAQAALFLRGMLHGSKRASHKKGAGALDCVLPVPQVSCRVFSALPAVGVQLLVQ